MLEWGRFMEKMVEDAPKMMKRTTNTDCERDEEHSRKKGWKVDIGDVSRAH
jgi:hypothetical protein